METRSSGKAVASLVCGILSLIIPFGGFVLGVLGIVFGVLARNEIRRSGFKLTGEGMAVAGFVCGILGVVGNGILFVIIWIIGVGIKPFLLDTLMTA